MLVTNSARLTPLPPPLPQLHSALMRTWLNATTSTKVVCAPTKLASTAGCFAGPIYTKAKTV